MNSFQIDLQAWLTKVADGCHEITTDPDLNMDLDFYACQSPITFSPDLLIIGANPGGGKGYLEKNSSENRTRRSAQDLCAGSNQFIEHYQDPAWRNLKPLCDLFSGDVLRPIFEEAVITNLIYFNSGTFPAFKKQKGYKRGLEFCLKMNFELIDLIKPKSILLMGVPVKQVFSRYLDHPMNSVLMADNGVSTLIGRSAYQGIPTFWIQHPSTFGPSRIFNYGKHQDIKKIAFQNIYEETLINEI